MRGSGDLAFAPPRFDRVRGGGGLGDRWIMDRLVVARGSGRTGEPARDAGDRLRPAPRGRAGSGLLDRTPMQVNAIAVRLFDCSSCETASQGFERSNHSSVSPGIHGG